MKKVIYDTNYYTDLTAGYPRVVENFKKHLSDETTILLPTIILHELLSNPKYDTETVVKKAVNSYIKLSKGNVVELSGEIAKKATEIRRYYRERYDKKLNALDAIIAATALLNEATLVSNNYNNFKYAMELGLVFENPIDDQEDLQNFRKSKKE